MSTGSSGAGAGPVALVRRPSPSLADGLVTHIERTPVDAELALRQWHRYTALLREHGWRTWEVEPADDCPDGVFVEDTVVVYRNAALIARPGAPSRLPETAGTERLLREAGLFVARVRAPGTLEGGDVLKVGDTVYVGCGGRTNAEGVRQLRTAFEPFGATVVPVPVRSVLHLKSAVTALPDGTVIGHPSLVDEPGLFPRLLSVPEEAGAHVVLLGGNRLLLSAAAPRTAELLASLGHEPVPVELSEYERLEGCVTCLSVRLRGLYELREPPPGE
ncbi:N(G),N(G)-dimethylarginine dimethylaminohydrolase [Streptomyces sp. P38-E01]|uniref:N(G),N(G)-dimethylarginine dimethylaminohydrolase n=1 Tax=Streptomyces tardus TaxID=2780544 RepID=A0A949N6A2_9ACTN|nr:dimethylargininase [Streptomyces tardus]MBU7599809.1 N(G),N(G)-dimethylarginine dimethylaminohydrolase [Streptomyces tardus]